MLHPTQSEQVKTRTSRVTDSCGVRVIPPQTNCRLTPGPAGLFSLATPTAFRESHLPRCSALKCIPPRGQPLSQRRKGTRENSCYLTARFQLHHAAPPFLVLYATSASGRGHASRHAHDCDRGLRRRQVSDRSHYRPLHQLQVAPICSPGVSNPTGTEAAEQAAGEKSRCLTCIARIHSIMQPFPTRRICDIDENMRRVVRTIAIEACRCGK